MITRLRWVALAVLVAAVVAAATGCGGGSNRNADHNNQVIQEAQQDEDTIAAVRQQLDSVFHLHQYAGIADVFTLVRGGTCSIDLIFSNDQVSLYRSNSSALIAPSGNVGVKVGFFEGTPGSRCLVAVKRALGW